MRRFSIPLLLAACGAQAAVPDDFAYGVRLDTPPGASVYEVELPATLYSNVARPDLGDLRVFNGRGDEVPYTLRRQQMVQGQAPAPQSVPLFPLYGEAAQDPDLNLRVQTDADGAIVELKNSRAVRSGAQWPEAYLFDLSALTSPPTALELKWELASGARGFVAHAKISASDDLAHWSTVAWNATLGDLGYGGNRLERRQIDLPPFSGKYLRIDWPAEARGARVTSAEVRFAAPATWPSRQWFPLEGRPDQNDAQRFEFSSGGFFPVDCARVVPREANTAARLTLASRAGADQSWRHRGGGVVYNLTSGKETLVSDSFCFEPTSDRAWQLVVEGNGGGFGHGAPGLELGWNPQRLVFVARGEGPFMLAYGSARVPAGGAVLDPLLQDLESQHVGIGKAAVSGVPFALAGPAQLEVRKEFPWRRVVLWGMLVGGVLVLAWMAWHLMRDLNRPAGV